MYCPKCRTQNPDNAQSCNACGAVLTPSSTTAAPIIPKISGMAIAALVLGLLSFIFNVLTGIPAVILGIIALITIEKSGGKITGKGFAIAGIISPVFSFVLLIAILMPALSRVRQTAFRMVCGTNLSGIGKAMLLYANENDDEFPRAGGRTATWSNRIADWRAPNRYLAYQMGSDGTGGDVTITSSLYLLIKYDEVTPLSFVCKADTGVRVFEPAEYGESRMDITTFWDFGPNPQEHCSYSYHMPYSPYTLTSSSEPGLAVAADRNPWIPGPGYEPNPVHFVNFNPVGGREYVSLGNSPSHQGEAQNVLFVDLHVNPEKTSACGVNDDNIYTFWGSNTANIKKGTMPSTGTSPSDRADSYLVNDWP